MPGWMEVFGFLTGAACVALLVRQNIWNWPLGIANNLVFIALFYRTGLYADVGLQGFYIVISVYGWWSWLHGGRDHGALTVSRVRPVIGALLLLAVAAITAVLSWLLRRYTNSTVPVLDSLITALSLVAQFMMTRKWIENWPVWIVANCISVGLLIYKGLYVTSGLYLVYQVLCVMGLLEWRRALKREATPSAG
ncbi:MAG: nicotinamide mononucleotide transporter [Geothrix sp.]|uniref:nicotinamide riboside transporter PnuC n=1 Tax=Geothrix sp. TaxID=1962974 RepID=UPI0017D4DBA9|nr:nicotinamide riboside transporter PnuC [Geothrix sp.]NWJ40240.1 nicotinamide mononucleotide transporter [Geothrix sp.]WIL21754.1 MAG: nicotinamide riboside transporter PnuC [Geothrix sp.]